MNKLGTKFTNKNENVPILFLIDFLNNHAAGLHCIFGGCQKVFYRCTVNRFIQYR